MAGSAPTTRFGRARLPLTMALAAGLTLSACSSDNEAQGTTAADPTVTSGVARGPLPTLQQGDLKAGYTVSLVPKGDVVNDQVSLTLCGAYRTEPYRTQRHAVVVADSNGNAVLSAESIRYQTEKYAMLSMADLRLRIRDCPQELVNHPVPNKPALRFEFFEPDKSKWPEPLTGVDRVATAYRATDAQDNSRTLLSVYQQSGDTLVALHTTVDTKLGQVLAPEIATIAGLSHAMAQRLQAAP